jgi:hypothetical protein
MDSDMKIFSVIVLFVLIIFGVVIVMSVYSINQGLITVERGFVVSKDFVEGSSSIVYSINIYNNTTSTYMTLYIFNDKALYDSIKINQTYSFSCLQSFKNKMEIIEYATEVE